MKIGNVLLLVLFSVFYSLQGQEIDSSIYNIQENSEYFDSDYIIQNEASNVEFSEDSINVDIKSISIHGLPKFNNDLDRLQYNRLKVKVYKLYPYLVLAVEQYNNLQDSMRLSKKTSEFKKYIKKRQKELSEEYEEKLKNLTKSEGKIFSKLMYRSTGKTVYEIIKELKSGWSAFWWNTKAGAFDIDLKEPFDPYYNRDDAYVEAILLRAYQFGDLEPIKDSDF